MDISKTWKGRVLGVFLSVVLAVGLMPSIALATDAAQQSGAPQAQEQGQAQAPEQAQLAEAPEQDAQLQGTTTNVQYVDADGTTKSVDATVVDSNMTGTWSEGWYVVNSNVTMSGASVAVSGDVKLILADGCTLTVTGGSDKAGITVTGTGNSLAVYGQALQTGKLDATGSEYGAGIGGGYQEPGSSITVNGGDVTATGGSNGAGIGGGYAGSGSDIIVNGGTVTATGNGGGAGIGGGLSAAGFNIAINGGDVTAAGSVWGGIPGAGIGLGKGCYTTSATNIKVAASLIVKADGSNPPTTVIAHADGQDIASSLADKQYATVTEPSYLTFTAQEANSTVKLSWISGENVETRTKAADGEWGAWAAYGKNSTITLSAVGDKLQFKGTGVTTNNKNCFTMTGKIAASGDVTSLTNGTGGDATLAAFCYKSMFQGCTSLETAPALPATTMAQQCYIAMFKGCTSLAAAPELPAKTLAEYCYSGMFSGCTSLKTAPEVLPATQLAAFCYKSMFSGCTSLEAAPALPAKTLEGNCYLEMFYNCTSLEAAPALSATALADSCYQNMFYNCTSLEAAPEVLPATQLAASCYSCMFSGCTSLEAAPALPATTLTERCYDGMFFGCTSLETAPVLSATALADSCYSTMFKNCTSLAAAPELPATTLAGYCYSSMFNGCTSLAAAPALSATTLAEYCYANMFSGCTSLTAVPNLSATTLKDRCYKQMFKNCPALAFSENGTQPATGGKVFTCPDTTGATDPVTDMFAGTSGAFTGTPTASNDYYWKVAEFSVSFDMQGHGEQVEAQTKEYGSKVDEPDDPSETGYAFGGWYKEAACDNAWNFDTDTVSKTTTLYAKWTAKTTAVTLSENGGTAGSKTLVEAGYDSDMPALTGAGELPTREGYTFTGYFDAESGGKQYYNADGTSANKWDKDVSSTTLYAQWMAIPGVDVPSDGSVKVTEETKAAIAKAQAEAADYYKKQSSATDVKINFKAEAAQAAEAADVALIKQAAGAKSLIAYGVFLTADYTAAGTRVTGVDYGSINGELIPVTYAFDFAKKADIQTFRCHNGVVDELTEAPNADGEFVKYDRDANTITVVAKKYSTYAFAYNEVADGAANVAKTGDPTLLVFAGLAAAAAAGIAIAIAARRRSQR